MVEKLALSSSTSGRKNGLYKNISTLEIDSRYQNLKSYQNPEKIPSSNNSKIPSHCNSSKATKKDSYKLIYLSNDETLQSNSRNSSECRSNLFEELKDLKFSLLSLQKNFNTNEKEFGSKLEKVKHLEAVSEKNSKKIQKIENILEKHQEQIIKFEGIFKEIEYKRLSDLKEQDLLRPALSERQMVSRHTFKDSKFTSKASSPKIKTKSKGNVGRLKSILTNK